MPLSAGTLLGPDEIVAPIGAGGMGEVYRARDTRLDRDVAIKVLPSALAQHPERLARFEREAKVLAALNHPNIAIIHGMEDRAIVMELVEGPTLADRIGAGAISVEEALKIALQIADALEAAHEKGVVHRDLKPANVKVREDGTVKVLDFGLATAVQSSGSEPGDSANSPTLTMGATELGVILGTAAYMSPEQARGQKVDKRADIWAFGVVLYELLTGERLFAGETVSDVLAHVLTQQPDMDRAPAKVRKLLRRCLEKDSRQRLRDIGEARFLLEEGEGEVPQAKARATWFLWPALAAMLGIVAASLAFVHFRQAPPEARVVNAMLPPPDGAEFDFGNPYALPVLSPDGTRIVFGAKPKDGKTQLWLRRLDSPAAQPLPGTEGAGLPFWSPDSRWVGFGQGSKLKKIDIQGGPPVAITDLAAQFSGGSWSKEGVIVFGVIGLASLFNVSQAGGTPAPATTVDQGKESNPHRQPWFLPDGRHFLYTSSQNGDIPVRVGSLDEPGKPGKVIAQAHSNVVYAQGHLLYLRENTLMAQPFDADRLETKGEAVPLAEGVAIFTQPARAAGFTVSAGGLLVYQSGFVGVQYRLVWKDRQGKTLGNLGEIRGQFVGIALSPDGKRLAAAIRDRSESLDIWIYDTARSIPTRFTFDPANDVVPVWSPDGTTLYFGSNRRGAVELFRKASNGTGAEDLLLSDSANKFPRSVSPDGKLLLYQEQGGKTGTDLWVLPLTPAQSGEKPQPRVFLRTPFNEARGQFSPDGQWVAYASDESGQNEVYAAPFPGPGGKRQISSGGATDPRWRRDGKELFYTTPGGQLMAAEIAARSGTLEVGRVQKLFDGLISNIGNNYDVSADGQKFLVVEGGATPPRPLTLLQNWPASLRK